MFCIGDRVEVVRLDDQYDPIAPGTRGTVDYVNEVRSMGCTQVGVKWDNGRSLMACIPPDVLRRVGGDERSGPHARPMPEIDPLDPATEWSTR